MRFAMPNHPFDFEIPDAWVEGIDLTRARAAGGAYRARGEATIVALHVIEPPRRNPWVPLDWRGFSRGRFITVLTRMLADQEIDPVPAFALPRPEHPPFPYDYRLADGYHRFFASVAAGFTHLPCDVLRPVD
ncbi:hypothetical protein [Methylobacterium sp. E-045]|uniref:hypothetical protein n=1 Tax=Methylobacterium sp. E-045 TaxID=2836575 RepID=UPI001FBB95B7|nr:hypothetical protein [Methylobacterium sp. E-045]MCJ2131279.1 hypothetical protein [Methylobacterium sp. E-045]